MGDFGGMSEFRTFAVQFTQIQTSFSSKCIIKLKKHTLKIVKRLCMISQTTVFTCLYSSFVIIEILSLLNISVVNIV